MVSGSSSRSQRKTGKVQPGSTTQPSTAKMRDRTSGPRAAIRSITSWPRTSATSTAGRTGRPSASIGQTPTIAPVTPIPATAPPSTPAALRALRTTSAALAQASSIARSAEPGRGRNTALETLTAETSRP